MMINTFTREFKACIGVCMAVRIGIGISKPSTKLACITAGNNYDELKASVKGADIAAFKMMEANRQTLYFAALHFE